MITEWQSCSPKTEIHRTQQTPLDILHLHGFSLISTSVWHDMMLNEIRITAMGGEEICMIKCMPRTGRLSLYEIVGVNFHLGEISIQSTEALLFYIQIGSSVHLHSIKVCYSSVFIRSAISKRTENVCDIRQLDSICLFSVEMEFQKATSYLLSHPLPTWEV